MSERKLTKAEARRKQAFEELKLQMLEAGYQTKELKLGVVQANIWAIVASAPFCILVLVVYGMLHGNPLLEDYSRWLLMAAIIIGIVVHELLHGLTWALFAKNGWKSIEFGVIWQYATPYCTCSEPMKKVPMILAAIMPTIILGFLPAVLGILLGKGFLIAFSLILIIGGGGDMLIILNILKYRSKTKEKLYLDHPYEVGTFVFEK